MKILLDNNLPFVLKKVFKDEAVHVRDVLSSNALDSEILKWSLLNEIKIIITKDKDFADKIILSNANIKCILCMYGNIKTTNLFQEFEKAYSHIENFVKSNNRLLKLFLSSSID